MWGERQPGNEFCCLFNDHLIRNDHRRRRLQSSYVFVGSCLIQTLTLIERVRRKATRKRFGLSFNNHLIRNDHGRMRLVQLCFNVLLIQTLITIGHRSRKTIRKRFGRFFVINHLIRNDHGRRRLQSSYVFGSVSIQTSMIVEKEWPREEEASPAIYFLFC